MLKRAAVSAALVILLAWRVQADCVASVTANFQGSSNYFLTYRYFGTVGSPESCVGTNLYARWDNGDWTWIGGGFTKTVDTGTITAGLPCYPPGGHSIDVYVECQKVSPIGLCVPDTPADAHATFTVGHSVAIIDAQPVNPPHPQGGSVNLSTKVAWQDEWPSRVDLKVYSEMTKTQSTVLSGAWTGVDGNGAATFNSSYDQNRPYMKLVAQACDKYTYEILGFGDNSCCCGHQGRADCTGGPIRMSNGNMRFTDSDPLPGLSLSRTYDSLNNDAGWFGPGWTSILDEWLRTETEPDGSTTVVIGTGGDDRFFFNNQSGMFRQLWPEGSSASSLQSDGSGGYVLREFGSVIERYFTGSGRIYKTRDVRNGRETTFSYVTDLITSVADSWGNWSWSITTDPGTQRITAISVPGTSIAWTYSYAAGVLTSVQESGNPWRTYTYSNNVLTAIHDGAGNLIESHAYGPDGATSSIGQTDDITSITYNNPTSDPNVRYTHVTMATGATADYYQRFIGGRYHTERVDGGCSSCATRNALYAFDSCASRTPAATSRSGHMTRWTGW